MFVGTIEIVIVCQKSPGVCWLVFFDVWWVS